MKFNDIYKDDAKVKPFLFAILFLGLAGGLYKGVLDNYLAEVIHIGKFDRGVVEFFRELPGLMLILILAVLCDFSENALFRIGCCVSLAGLCLIRLVPPGKALVIFALTVYSVGEHINLGMKSSLTLDMSKPGLGGTAMGMTSFVTSMGAIMGFVAVSVLFLFLSGLQGYKTVFTVAMVLYAFAILFAFLMGGERKTQTRQSRFYFRKKFNKYYMLEVFYGARKQVYLTFGPYVLILYYHAPTSVIGMLYAICAISEVVFSPLVGKIIDRFGYRIVMIMDTLILVVVCFFYGFSPRFFAPHTAYILACVSYVLDSIISLASMASSVYVQDIATDRSEVRATLSTGISVNHLISILIALFGGWIWQKTGIEVLFTLSALLGVANSVYAATIPKEGVAMGRRRNEQGR